MHGAPSFTRFLRLARLCWISGQLDPSFSMSNSITKKVNILLSLLFPIMIHGLSCSVFHSWKKAYKCAIKFLIMVGKCPNFLIELKFSECSPTWFIIVRSSKFTSEICNAWLDNSWTRLTSCHVPAYSINCYIFTLYIRETLWQVLGLTKNGDGCCLLHKDHNQRAASSIGLCMPLALHLGQ